MTPPSDIIGTDDLQLKYQKEIIDILFAKSCENSENKPQTDGLEILTSLKSFLEQFPIDVTLQNYTKIVEGIAYERANLIAKKRGATGPFIALQGHIDTVPCGEPYAYCVTSNEIIGRGAVDMKGPLLGCVSAFLELIEKGNDKIMLIITDDEETDFDGIKKLIEEKDTYLGNIEFCINAEPTNMLPCYKTRGFGQYEILEKGYTAHSSSSKNDFLIERMIPLMNAVGDYLAAVRNISDPVFGSTRAALTVLQAGEKSNQLPSSFQLVCNMRLVTKDLKQYRNLFDTTVRPVCAGLTVNEIYFEPFDSLLSEEIKGKIQKSFADCNVEYREAIMHAFTESYMFNEAGIPCFSWGPGDMDLAHVKQSDERIRLEEIASYCAVVCNFIASL